MTDHAELRRLAEQASSGNWYGEDSQVLIGKHAVAYCNHKVDAQFIGKANPKTVLALLDEIDGLSDELSACTEHPGGCGYWREAAKRRAEERDRLRAQNDALRGALQAVVDDPTWRSNDNTLWPKIIKAMDKGATQ
ncbi:ead/Ea22-like family protein [Pseudomonas aeruginosa]|uniref:ead/Ea22-like family protein n=1 Tax=Pseudomonas aeruginosa TaxID=287 RepID=UPI00117A36D0|nr:ead/Ea22-like family protein [Pseudomonas aeruginosa]